MNKKAIIKKGVLAFLSGAMMVGMLQGTGALSAKAEAAGGNSIKENQTTYLGVRNIYNALTHAENVASSWRGSYVYYGTNAYQAEKNPIKFRVLDSEDARGLYVDCDEVLTDAKYGDAGKNVNLLAEINGPLFYGKCLNSAEQDALVQQPGGPVSFLSADIYENPETAYKYGYAYLVQTGVYQLSPGTFVKGGKAWWLQHKASTDAGKKTYTYAYCTENGAILTNRTSEETKGISPAFYINPEKVLFATQFKENDVSYGYKLTLMDSEIETTVTTPEEGFLRIDGDTGRVTVPYEVTGKHASDVTDMTVLVTKGAYNDSKSSIASYQKAIVNKNGTISFVWDDGWEDNDNYHIYLIAEHRTAGYFTDSASAPCELDLPSMKKEINSVDLTFSAPFSAEEDYPGDITETAQQLSSIKINGDTAVTADDLQVQRKDKENEDHAQFNTEYNASFSLKISNDQYVFAKTGMTVTIHTGDQTRKITAAVSEDSVTANCTGLEFKTRPAKFLKVVTPTAENDSIEVNYASSYRKIKDQLQNQYGEAMILVEGNQQVTLPITWENKAAEYDKNATEGKKFSAYGTIDPKQVNIDGSEQTVWIMVQMAAKKTLPAPVITYPEGEDSSTTDLKRDRNVYLSVSESDEELTDITFYYTLDGTSPTEKSSVYNPDTGILLEGDKEGTPVGQTGKNKDVTLKVLAVKEDWNSSSIAQTYSFAPRYKLTVDGGYITSEYGNAVSGTEKTEGVYAQGVEIKVEAFEKEGYTFKNWTSSGNTVFSKTKEGTWTTENRTGTLTANYVKTPQVTISAKKEVLGKDDTCVLNLKEDNITDRGDFQSISYKWFRKALPDGEKTSRGENKPSLNETYITYPSDGYEYWAEVTYKLADSNSEVVCESNHITITFHEEAYSLTVKGGKIQNAPAGQETNGDYEQGTDITVTADDAQKGWIFAGWKATDSTDKEVTLENTDLSKKTITFAMPESDLTLTAEYVQVTEPTLTGPENVTVKDGEKAIFSVTVDYPDAYQAEDFSYQWQEKAGASAEYQDIEGANASSYEITKVSQSMDGYQYRCVVVPTLNGVEQKAITSSEATLTVSEEPPVSDALIKTQPSSVRVQEGDEAKFTVTAEASEGCTLSYEWQQKDSDGTWKKAGSDASYTIKQVTKEMDGRMFRCIVTETTEDGSEGRTETSNEVTLTVSETPQSTGTVTVVGGTADKESYEPGDTVKIRATIPDGQKFSEWKADKDDIQFEDASSSSTSFKMPDRDSVTVTAVFKDGYKIEITGQPENVSVPAGGNATFKVSASSSYEMVYEWKADYNDGKGFQTVGAGPEYTVENVVSSLNGARYQCIITLVENRDISVTSSAAVLTVEAPDYTVKVNSGTASVTSTKPGETITIKANAAPDGQEFLKWTVINGRVNLADPSSMETTFTMPSGDVELTATYQKKLAVPTITSQPEDVTVTAGTSARFRVEVSGEELSYQWKVDKTDGNGYADISGATSAGYTVYTEDGSMNGYKYKCEVKNRAGSAESKEAVLTVVYKITDGARATWTKSNSNGMSFRGSGAYAKFRYIRVDDDKVSSGNYTKKSDPTIITLLPSYLEKLSSGKHTLTMVWEDGTAETTFTISGTTAASSSAAATSSTTGGTSTAGSSQKDASFVKRKTNY